VFQLEREPDPCRTIAATLISDAFCHSMVRSLMGAVVQIGLGRRNLDWLRTIRESPTRESSVPVLPPQGLTLEEVGYPPDPELAARVTAARSPRTPGKVQNVRQPPKRPHAATT
jgi:tRNA pseudouridine38-40 synthase